MYEIAKMDLKSANILAKNEMYPQSIYFYEQSFEKALKSVVSEYLRHRRNMTDSQIENELRPKGHNVIEKTMQMMTLMIEEEVQLYIKRGGNESDPFIQNTYDGINKYIEHEYPQGYHVIIFYPLVMSHYRDFYSRFYIPRNDPMEWRWDYLRWTYSNPAHQHFKFMSLSWIISPILKNMDILTRYPTELHSLNSDNVRLLMDKKFLIVCNRLYEMLNDYIELVPLVWLAINK
jgi:hypothetical protein